MYSIEIDRRTLLIDVRISGFFSAELSDQVRDAVRATIRTLGPEIGRHVTLYDVSDLSVAPGAVIDAVKSDFVDREAIRLRARRVAYCTPSALARLQAARIREARPDIAVFATRAEAIAWLTDPSADPDRQAA